MNRKQKEILTGFSEKFAIVSATALVAGQFVPGQTGDWKVVVIGALLTCLSMFFAVVLNRDYT